MISPMQQFRDAILAAGLIPPDVIETDGILHRFSSNGEQCDDAGWYVFFNDGIPAGIFGDWRTGLCRKWCAGLGRALTPTEKDQHRAKFKTMRAQREAERRLRQDEAQVKAVEIWQKAQLAPENHSYLLKKGVKPHGLKVHYGRLIIPLYFEQKIHSLQFIGEDGEKRFLTGGRVAGCYYNLGNPTSADTLCIAEGFATGASIHEASGYSVTIAFSAGNIGPVAKAMRLKFASLPMLLCADNDTATPGNPGLSKATKAAKAVGGRVATPDLGDSKPDGKADFNDMSLCCGLEAVRKLIAREVALLIETDAGSTKTGVSEVSGVQASNGALSANTSGEVCEVSKVSETPRPNSIPDLKELPTFRVYDDSLEQDGFEYKPGVWYFCTDKDGNLTRTWICSPLHVEAVTFDRQDIHFGRLLRFRNTLGYWHEWAMPMEMLSGSCEALRAELLSMGVEMDASGRSRNLLANYLQANRPERRMRCALQVGWCDGSFVLPDAVIGSKALEVIFQSGERGHDEYTRSGDLMGWQAEISALAVGNPLFILALSASFAGPMLALCNAEGGGIHFVGDSSTGKTTLLESASSVWGGPNYRRSWRTTANGMEGAGAMFNDCLLVVDEISECEPREVGAIVYALANGRGKQRASRSGNARAVTRWRCLVLSSGERTIATSMDEGGYRAKAGQAVRLLDIPARRTFGTWDNLHGLSTGTTFSDSIKRSVTIHYGHAGRAFLEKLTRDERDFCARLERIKALPEFSSASGEGQDKRAAGRFALFTLAGEVATEYGLTGWPEGEALHAAAIGFKAWQSMRGHGNDERRQILRQVADFIERHGDGRFSDAGLTADIQMRERAGWWCGTGQSRKYLFTSEGMREALKGFDFKPALTALQEAGALPESTIDGKRAHIHYVGGQSRRLYPINFDNLGVDDGA